jgi:amino acid transporter
MSRQNRESMGYWGAVSIGVGGMVGGGIFAVLGLAVQLAHGGTPVAFVIAGAVALVTAYSYTRLSVAWPSQGGTVRFLDRAFGSGLLTGTLNVLLWLSYMVMLSLYAYAFGSYGATFLPESLHTVAKHVLISAGILGIAGLNLLGASIIGKAETWIVGLKVAILLVFVGIGVWGVRGSQIVPAQWAAPVELVAGGMIIFLAYEGFELIANTAKDLRDPAKTLPAAFFSAVGFVIFLYAAVALVTVGNLSVSQVVAAKDYALAEAARPFMGQTGFVLIAVAAILSTASAINATLYGAARISFTVAHDGELPAELEKQVWEEPVVGLLITAAVPLLVANLFDFSSISTMGSAGFLLIFAAVNAANVWVAGQTGSRWWISGAGAVACLLALLVLICHTASNAPGQLWVLAVMLGLSLLTEAGYRFLKGRRIRLPG